MVVIPSLLNVNCNFLHEQLYDLYDIMSVHSVNDVQRLIYNFSGYLCDVKDALGEYYEERYRLVIYSDTFSLKSQSITLWIILMKNHFLV